MVFEDRLSARPNRYLMTDESGTEKYITLNRADEPTVVGTPLNADTFNRMQEEIQIASLDHPGCYYRLVGGEQEWINPPMIPGVVYRTAERYNGKAVYACIYQVPELSGTVGSSTVKSLSDLGVSNVVSFDPLFRLTGDVGECHPYPPVMNGAVAAEFRYDNLTKQITITPYAEALATRGYVDITIRFVK